MSARTRSRVEHVLANLPPGLIEATQYPELMGKVRVTLDGEEVTARCRAFSIDPGEVALLVLDERGKKTIASVCGCGQGHFSRRGTCDVCGSTVLLCAKTEERRGVVEVVPLDDQEDDL